MLFLLQIHRLEGTGLLACLLGWGIDNVQAVRALAPLYTLQLPRYRTQEILITSIRATWLARDLVLMLKRNQYILKKAVSAGRKVCMLTVEIFFVCLATTTLALHNVAQPFGGSHVHAS